MRRRTVTAFLLAAALAFLPMGGHLAMTAEASGTGTAEGTEEVDDCAAVGGSETGEETDKELVILGWTEDGKASVYIDPSAEVWYDYKWEKYGKNDNLGEVNYGNHPAIMVFDAQLLKDGEVLPTRFDQLLISTEMLIPRIMEQFGSGTYQYGMGILKDEMSWSPEYVYVAPGEEEPGENEGNGGSTEEPGGDEGNGGSTAEPDRNTVTAPKPEPWKPTPEEVRLYEACGAEEPVFTESADNAYSVTVANSIQGFLCWNAFDSVRGDYTIGRTYNIYPTDLGKVYQMDSKARITLTIPETLRAENRSFQMLVVTEDGKPAVLKDLDSASDTITFETDAYYAFALVYKD